MNMLNDTVRKEVKCYLWVDCDVGVGGGRGGDEEEKEKEEEVVVNEKLASQHRRIKSKEAKLDPLDRYYQMTLVFRINTLRSICTREK